MTKQDMPPGPDPVIIQAPVHFCIGDALKDFEEQDNSTQGLFSLSPLTSPEITPPGSPSPPLSFLPSYDSTPFQATAPSLLQQNNTPPPRHPVSSLEDVLPAEGLQTALSKSSRRKARRNKKVHSLRAKQRELGSPPTLKAPRINAWRKYVANASIASSSMDLEFAPVTKTGFTATNDHSRDHHAYSLHEVTGESSLFNLRLLQWDGMKPTVVVDSQGRGVVILAGHPEDDDWHQLQKEASRAIEERRSQVRVKSSPKGFPSLPRRGDFLSLRCGVSHGGGQKRPQNFRNSKANAQILLELNALAPFKRLAGFASSVMKTWANDLYTEYSTMLQELHKDESLVRVFPRAIFSAYAYNFGPQTICYTHRDFANLSYGFCAVTALGSFDPKRGGHLIVWELGVVIEFPPGSTILLPSALLSHANTTIASHEQRFSFTQFSAGGLFRWVAHDCLTKREYVCQLSVEQRIEHEALASSRWSKGLQMFPMFTKVPYC